jgi:hypothetical protein
MFTVRRGVARVGWVLVGLWSIAFALILWDAPAPNPPVALATFLGVPLAIFLLWRLLLWICEGFWQRPP